MKNSKLTIEYDAEKLSAIQQFSDGKLEQVLQEQLDKIYAKVVPKAVQQYLEGKTGLPPKQPDKTKQVKGSGL